LFASPFPIVADQYQNTRTHTFYVEVQAQDWTPTQLVILYRDMWEDKGSHGVKTTQNTSLWACSTSLLCRHPTSQRIARCENKGKNARALPLAMYHPTTMCPLTSTGLQRALDW
jgi:hypothetical protein